MVVFRTTIIIEINGNVPDTRKCLTYIYQYEVPVHTKARDVAKIRYVICPCYGIPRVELEVGGQLHDELPRTVQELQKDGAALVLCRGRRSPGQAVGMPKVEGVPERQPVLLDQHLRSRFTSDQPSSTTRTKPVHLYLL